MTIECPRCSSDEHGGDVDYSGCSVCREPPEAPPHPCPRGDDCALNKGAVKCQHCGRNWPPDETWQRPAADSEAVLAVCPKCGALVEDLDGFGVLIHDECGYCSHPDAYGGVCKACGASV